MAPPLIAGLNLSYLVDYRQQCPFKNELRMARVWWEADASSGAFIQSRLTSEHPDTGYPLSLPGGRVARTLLGTGLFQRGGTWSISFDGSGTVEVSAGSGTQTFIGGSGAYGEFQRSATSAVQITIRATSPANPIRNMWVGRQESYASRLGDRLDPGWRDHIVRARIQCLRFMQWQRITPAGDSGCLVQAFLPAAGIVGVKSPWDATTYRLTGAEYFTDSDYIQGPPGGPDGNMGNGCTLSSLLICAIETGVSRILVCVPHLVDEGQADVPYVRELLRFVRDFRHPSRGTAYTGTIILEYSNETWNPAFPQYHYCRARGVALGLDGVSEHDQGNSFYAYRSKQIFDTALAARSDLGLVNAIETMLAGQAGTGEYPFRFRTQIGARSASPVNVSATYWSPASYFAHIDYDGGSDTILLGDRLMSNGNSPLTQAQFTALSDAQLATQCRRDIDNRVFRAVSTSNDATFPSHPTIRSGGILADLQFAAARGMQVLCYEGGGSHIVVPGSWGQAAKDRSVAWHQTAEYGAEVEHNLNRHVDAGCLGTILFDEGTGHVGEFGCWSWYRDHRDGYDDDAKYSAVLRHHLSGAGSLFARMPLPEVVARAAPMTATIAFSNNISSQIGQAMATALAGPMVGTIVGDPLTASLSTAVAVASAGAMMSSGALPPLSASLAEARIVARAGAVTGSVIGQPPAPPTANCGPAVARATATAFTATLNTGGLAVSLGAAVAYPCAARFTARLQTFSLGAVLPAAIVLPRAMAHRAVLAGSPGSMTTQKVWTYQRIRRELAGSPPHGTTIYRGQLLGLIDGRPRPWRLRDPFAGIARETVSGLTTGPDGQPALRTEDYTVRYAAQADLWILLDRAARVGDSVYPRSDQEFTTLAVTGVDPVGEIVLVAIGGRRALIRFAGAPIRQELLA